MLMNQSWKNNVNTTYRIISEDKCERKSGIEPVKLLCDKFLQTHQSVLFCFRDQLVYKIKMDSELSFSKDQKN